MDESIPEPLNSDDKEVKKASTLATSTTNKEQCPNLLKWLEYFLSWFRAKRAVAVCLRYRRILLERAHSKKMTNGELKTRFSSCKYKPVNVELNAAEQEIVRRTQVEAFKEEIRKLKNRNANHEVQRGDDSKSSIQGTKGISSLYRLDPFLDRRNLVRIGGRIKQASVSKDIKHPIVLPGQGHISKLLAWHYHKKALHQGKGITLTKSTPLATGS